ncbi:MAG: hypothetical protein PHQ36_07525 [Anaerolineales bacterium]|nr:hypothetical protein [Anaerolineales bacterium]
MFLSALPGADAGCLPDKTEDDLGVYIYDLSVNQELISINEDAPFQFASAFKAPVLVYFLSRCKKYWDPESPAWDSYIADIEAANNIERYVTPEYRDQVAQYVADVNNWGDMERFFAANRFDANGVEDPIDQRFFVLGKAYSMITRSNNFSTGDILRFVYDNCQPEESAARLSSTRDCYQPNAISQFNLWFNEFSNIEYRDDEIQRGLFKWDVVVEDDANGKPYEVTLPTHGLKDKCASQTARLGCVSDIYGKNVWTARDLFKFYKALAYFDDDRARAAALGILAIDKEGPARGNLKNLARKMGATSMSKNGHARFVHGSINTDAGIFYYRDVPFIVVTLGYDAQSSLSLLYGDYASDGSPLTDRSLIRDLLDAYLASRAGG